MTIARKLQIDLSVTPYYHITSRCVRRAFLCGKDPLTKKSYDHRRQWIEDRIRLLSSLFTIQVCSYGVMSNHYHVVVKIVPEEAKDWTNEDVINRWLSIFKGPLIVRQFIAGESLTSAELSIVDQIVTRWRKELTNISWFMKCLNEPIARQANKEDGCRGHFWEARFDCQSLPSDEALLSAMVYVDLNPLRAGIAPTPEPSDYTSIKERLRPRFNRSAAIKSFVEHGGFASHLEGEDSIPIRPLATFVGDYSENGKSGIHFEFRDYLELIDYTGRIIRDDKRSFICPNLPPILERLKTSENDWTLCSLHFESVYHQRFGRKQHGRKERRVA